MAPITTVQDSLTGPGPIDSITVQATSESSLNAAEAEVTQVLEERHKIKDTAEPGFNVLNQGSLLETSNSTSSVFTTLLGEVAAISLLVGGIGVMNIMLVSVTERTREIGVRKAIGARRRDIILQFLTEAVVLTSLGGMCGMIAGYMISFASRLAFPTLPSSVPMWAAGLGLVVSIGIGLFFGIWPASKAARLDPVEALRYE
jgi:putative ABC transport system permease protein